MQRVLKQTQPYLEERGAKAAERARQGREAADMGAAAALKNMQTSNKEERNFDL